MRPVPTQPCEPGDSVGWMLSVERIFLDHESECAARLQNTESELVNLRVALDGAMGSIAQTFRALTEEAGDLAADRKTSVNVAVEAIQFHDIGGQWLAHLAAEIRQTRELVASMRVPFQAMRAAANGDWHGFERDAAQWEQINLRLQELRLAAASRPVGHAPECCGDVEIF
ncbi:MAG: hypothetical protein ACKVQK_10345 [Burkholderiales bacterium]